MTLQQEITLLHLYNTQLRDRILWADGSSTFEPDQLIKTITSGQIKIQPNKMFVTEVDKRIEQYNKYVSDSETIGVKKQIDRLDFNWDIPVKYADLSVIEYTYQKLEQCNRRYKWTEEEFTKRSKRLSEELTLYHKYGLFGVLRAIIYIINTLTKKGTVWGVGRGSSVSSYVLYLIGVHDVDSFKYDLDINEFIHSVQENVDE